MIHVAGGVYKELCAEPAWNRLMGSGMRGATVLANSGGGALLSTFASELEIEFLRESCAAVGVQLSNAPRIPHQISFIYDLPLSTPLILPLGSNAAQPINVESEKVLRYGILEGDAIVRAKKAVYDPQSKYKPVPFRLNGSSAEQLAVVANFGELKAMVGGVATQEDAFQQMFEDSSVRVVVMKNGPWGAIVATPEGDRFPVAVRRTGKVWKIGSGDVFSSLFAHYWMEEDLAPQEAADLASIGTAYYCSTRKLPNPQVVAGYGPEYPSIRPISQEPAPQVYLAGPFFTTAQRWMIGQARAALNGMGLKVFSPYHDVGIGSAAEVVGKDIQALKDCSAIFAIVDGCDAGTLFEIGYGRALGKPVIAFVQNEPEEPLKMLQGTDCTISDDFTSAIYSTFWSLLDGEA